MDYLEEYQIKKQLLIKVIIEINLVHLYKKVYLPIELVGVRGNKQTEAFNEIKVLSPIE